VPGRALHGQGVGAGQLDHLLEALPHLGELAVLGRRMTWAPPGLQAAVEQPVAGDLGVQFEELFA
jgi:hypothetical protein